MSQQELLKLVVESLEELGIAYMVTGSIASSLHGEPRATHDVDIVVDLSYGHVEALVQRFPEPRFYLDEAAVREAIARNGMFNLLDTAAGDKVDFWILTDEPFDQSRFARRQPDDSPGYQIFVSSPEDTILMKLRWAKMSGGSQKQRGDALAVAEVQSGALDMRYMDDWALRIGVADDWRALRREAGLER